MYQYGVADWILLFFIYGFFGWFFETTYVSARNHRFVNRGFLKGPVLPIYAFGAIIILFVTIPLRGNPVAIYFAGTLVATLWELIVGLAMESIFKVKYWDYSSQKFQYKGVICLSSSIAWGFLALFLTEVIHKPIEKVMFQSLPMLKYILVAIFGIIFITDTVISVKAALDLKKMLEKMTVMRMELEELLGNTQERLEAYQHFKSKLEEYREYSKSYGALKAHLLKAHPSATSAKYKEALKDIRKYIEDEIKEKKNKIKNKFDK